MKKYQGPTFYLKLLLLVYYKGLDNPADRFRDRKGQPIPLLKRCKKPSTASLASQQQTPIGLHLLHYVAISYYATQALIKDQFESGTLPTWTKPPNLHTMTSLSSGVCITIMILYGLGYTLAACIIFTYF